MNIIIINANNFSQYINFAFYKYHTNSHFLRYVNLVEEFESRELLIYYV